MTAFRLLLAAMLATIIVYTGQVMLVHGGDLIPVFFGDIGKMGWPGQFNTDFSCFLMLSGLWVAWRNQFSVGGLLLAIVAAFGGMLFLSLYLLILSFRTGNDFATILLGKTRAEALRGMSGGR